VVPILFFGEVQDEPSLLQLRCSPKCARKKEFVAAGMLLDEGYRIVWSLRSVQNHAADSRKSKHG